MGLGAPTSRYLAALSPTRFGRGWLIWRLIILRLLATRDPDNLSYAKPQLEIAAKLGYPLSRGNEISQTLLDMRPAPTHQVPLGRAAQPILLGLMKTSHLRFSPR